MTRTLSFDHALGAVLGALSGDAIGTTLEFMGRKPEQDQVVHALTMPGGGNWEVTPGQLTDDGELTLTLLDTLIGCAAYPEEEVAGAYVAWVNSRPFDIGTATRQALSGHWLVDPDCPSLADLIRRAALRHNEHSKANGSLMRVSALGAWAAKLDFEDAVAAAHADARLTHPHPACQHATAAYVAAIRYLVLEPGDSVGAIAAARSALLKERERDGEVNGWLDDALAGRLPPGYPEVGFAKIAFTYAFHHLYEQSDAESALADTLAIGGDTDTNACVVGGLVGALHGAAKLPQEWVHTLETVDLTRGRPRPRCYTARDVRARMARLMEVPPVAASARDPRTRSRATDRG
jgi:ADP-ribosyl-[dinitrogen reductase] hydrolase